jgi:hypothetical protein
VAQRAVGFGRGAPDCIGHVGFPRCQRRIAEGGKDRPGKVGTGFRDQVSRRNVGVLGKACRGGIAGFHRPGADTVMGKFVRQ